MVLGEILIECARAYSAKISIFVAKRKDRSSHRAIRAKIEEKKPSLSL